MTGRKDILTELAQGTTSQEKYLAWIDVAKGIGMLILAFFLNGLELQLPFSLVPAFCATFFVLAGMFLRERRIFEKMRVRHYIAALLTVFLICLYGVFSGSPKSSA